MRKVEGNNRRGEEEGIEGEREKSGQEKSERKKGVVLTSEREGRGLGKGKKLKWKRT